MLDFLLVLLGLKFLNPTGGVSELLSPAHWLKGHNLNQSSVAPGLKNKTIICLCECETFKQTSKLRECEVNKWIYTGLKQKQDQVVELRDWKTFSAEIHLFSFITVHKMKMLKRRRETFSSWWETTLVWKYLCLILNVFKPNIFQTKAAYQILLRLETNVQSCKMFMYAQKNTCGFVLKKFLLPTAERNVCVTKSREISTTESLIKKKVKNVWE